MPRPLGTALWVKQSRLSALEQLGPAAGPGAGADPLGRRGQELRPILHGGTFGIVRYALVCLGQARRPSWGMGVLPRTSKADPMRMDQVD